ncbi:MAG TPA: nicotinate-nucleotide adenylyltransferase [Candidatus Binatia bacterium]|nr:nicotinate-nucleotide adenylyltransferase [Candidatus Binatia bacterium]
MTRSTVTDRPAPDRSTSPPRIGVLGGTFDPIHIAHLAVAEEARDALGLERVLFVPAGRPPFKLDDPVTAVEHRVAMVAAAIADNPAFELSTIEVDRAGPSYTSDTLEALARAFPGAVLFLIVSVETLAELPSWHEPERLVAAARVAVAPREGYAAPDPAWLAGAIPGRELRVDYLEGPRLELSSTALRTRVAAGRSIRYLVPPPVEAYIQEHELYRRRLPAT